MKLQGSPQNILPEDKKRATILVALFPSPNSFVQQHISKRWHYTSKGNNRTLTILNLDFKLDKKSTQRGMVGFWKVNETK